MIDPQENIPQENVTLPENNSTADVTTTETKSVVYNTKAEIINRTKELVGVAEEADKAELDALKQQFYKLHNIEVSEAKAAFVAAGGDPDKFQPESDPDEEVFKAEMGLIKEKRAARYAQIEQEKEENYQKKLAIIERVKELASTPEEANKNFTEFKELQQQWKEIKQVPADKANELWKTYQLHMEQFYDLLKLNHELREYDFKKNLETKTRLCEEAEKLAERKDIITAFRELQNLHAEYRETGPVAKEQREEIWNRFKAATTVINKKHQQYFEEVKAQEAKNLEAKTAICEELEAMDLAALTSFNSWTTATEKVIALQAKWKTIGYAPQKMNLKIYERFHTSCDLFFQKKSEFYKAKKSMFAENYKLQTALCEKAEALKDSTDWKSTSDKFVNLQKEWKKIGPVAKKHSEELWKRFITACDYFYEQKNKNTSSQRNEEHENLAKKKDVIERLQALVTDAGNDAQQKVKELMAEWNAIGHVPFKEKDKIYQAYHELVDKLYKELNQSNGRRRLNNFKNSIKNAIQKEGGAINKERDRLMRSFESLSNEIKTYENNIGFLTSSSKKGNSLVNEMKNRVEKLKSELDLIRQKVNAIDEERRKKADEADDAKKDDSAAE